MADLTNDELNEIGFAVSHALAKHQKHFVLLMVGEGPTKLEILSDIRGQPEAIIHACKWAQDVVDGTESDDPQVYGGRRSS